MRMYHPELMQMRNNSWLLGAPGSSGFSCLNIGTSMSFSGFLRCLQIFQ